MNRTALHSIVTGALVAASLSCPWLASSHTRTLLEEKAASLARLDAELAGLTANNLRLSNQVARAKAPLSTEEFHELMRLRGGIVRLRRGAAAAAKLKVALRKAQPLSPDTQEILAHWTSSELSCSGYADPISGLQTALWAIHRNDPEAISASMALDLPYVASRLAFAGNTPAEQLSSLIKPAVESLAPANGFSVVGQTSPSEGQFYLDVYFEGEGVTRPFLMMNRGGNWKLRGIYQANPFPVAALGGYSAAPVYLQYWP